MSRLSRQSLVEPAWHDMDSFRAADVPAAVWGWLTDAGSLTSKLIDTCGPGYFRVNLVGQHWARPLYSEKQALGMRRGEVTLVREVQLLCDQTPWVFARTLIPASSFSGKARRLAFLGNKPLGALLFSDPTTVRNKMQVGRLSAGHLLHAHASHGLGYRPDELWARRTLFFYAQHPLLVNEIFLPEIPGDFLSSGNE
mgnify:CR=1 FL=1